MATINDTVLLNTLAAMEQLSQEIKRISIAMRRHCNDPAKIRSLAKELEECS